ncbi:HEPN domain-containing protein [Celeribacter sp.]|uniref:HEPN domain-containing protein n=1 Tax=Celeribacter sp. TaxID=1890673 RepID=UPI003A8DB805
MSKPYNYFESSITRSTLLVELAKTNEDHCDDISRAAAVLAVAAYDHYFTSKFSDVLASYLSKNEPNKSLLEMLERGGLNTKVALEIAVMKRPFRRVRSLITKSLSEKTTNRTKAIDNLFAAIDLKGLSGRVHKKAARTNLGTRIDKLVDIRNAIVHSAHLNSHGKPRAINIDDIEARIGEVKLFVETAEQIINEWIKHSDLPALVSATD